MRHTFSRRTGTVLLMLAVLMVIMLNPMAVCADSSDKKFVYDEAGVLAASEKSELEAYAHRTAEKCKVDIIIVFVDARLNTNQKIRNFADDFYDQHAFGYDRRHGDGVILVIDTKARYDHIGTSGNAADFFTSSRLDSLGEKVENKLGSNDWAGGAKQFVSWIESHYRNPNAPYSFGERVAHSAENIPMYLLLSIAISGLIIVIMIRFRANRVTVNQSTYLRPGSFVLAQRDDIFMGETTTRVRIRSNNGGHSGGGHSGGGGMHISSGGFSHGGRSGRF